MGRKHVAELLRTQAGYCHQLGSPLYGELLERAAADVEVGGPVWDLLEPHEDDPAGSALALRFMGATHRLALEGRAPELARCYPSAGGSADPEAAWVALRALLTERAEDLAPLIDRPVQTNEVGRAAGLIGGFLAIAAHTGLPLRLLEIGASAGLLLRWDRFRYEARGATWGPEDSPVRLCDFNSEEPLPFDAQASVASREGCDPSPVDATSDEGRLTLLSYVWPDQIGRIRNLRAALEVAAQVPAQVEGADAAGWLEEKLAEPSSGVATVVYHSIVWQYLSDDQLDRVTAAIEGAAAGATDESPFAWLRMEAGGDIAHVRLALWPGGADKLVTTCSYHGAAVRWLGY